MLIDHRGSCYEMPENTLVSVMKGWEEGADAVATDRPGWMKEQLG
jgi:glycerophosphoryl diester phosphodiesterase